MTEILPVQQENVRPTAPTLGVGEVPLRELADPDRPGREPGAGRLLADEPPFHTPVFVLTHHPRPSFTRSDTTFHFVSGEPADVLSTARAAAPDRAVRLGGGANSIGQFLDADLVDTLHVAVYPIQLGSGSRLWRSPVELDDRFHRDEVASPSGVVHTCCGAAEDRRAPREAPSARLRQCQRATR